MPGSLVFRPTSGPVDLRDFRNWWAWTPGRPGASPRDRDRRWRPRTASGRARRLHRTRGLRALGGQGAADRGGVGVRGARRTRAEASFAWGDEFAPRGRMMANTWQGEFPWQNLLHRRLRAHLAGQDVSRRTATACTTSPGTSGSGPPTCSHPSIRRVRASLLRARATREHDSDEQSRAQPARRIPRKVIKGGSHLCAPNYCLRYRPAARQGEAIDTSTSHIGFRCVLHAEEG